MSLRFCFKPVPGSDTDLLWFGYTCQYQNYIYDIPTAYFFVNDNIVLPAFNQKKMAVLTWSLMASLKMGVGGWGQLLIQGSKITGITVLQWMIKLFLVV